MIGNLLFADKITSSLRQLMPPTVSPRNTPMKLPLSLLSCQRPVLEYQRTRIRCFVEMLIKSTPSVWTTAYEVRAASLDPASSHRARDALFHYTSFPLVDQLHSLHEGGHQILASG